MLVDRVLRDLDLPDPDERTGNPIRGSRLGRCARQSAYMLWPDAYPPEPLPARAKLVFRFGDMIHEMVRREFRRVVPGEWGMEEERFHFKVPLSVKEADAAWYAFESGALTGYVEAAGAVALHRRGLRALVVDTPEHKRGLWLAVAEPALYVPLHVDGIADTGDGLASVEIKSMATSSFKRAVKGHVDYAYRVQMAAAVDATALDTEMYVAVRKDTSHLLEIVYTKKATEVTVTFTKSAFRSEVATVDAGPGEWESAEVRHPFEAHLLEQARERVRRILRATVTVLPEREYGPDFTCATCEGTGTQSKAKNTGLPLVKGPKPCADCERGPAHGVTFIGAPTGRLARAELPFQCRYAIPPDANILLPDLSWVPAGKVVAGATVFGFDEEPPRRYRRTRLSQVTEAREVVADTLVITTERGVLRCSPEHPWLVKDPGPEGGIHYRRGVEWQPRAHWREAATIRPSMGIAMLTTTETLDDQSDDYLAGYVRGLVEGDGTMQARPPGPYVRVAMTDPEALDRLTWALHAFRIPWSRSLFNPGHSGFAGRKAIERVLFGGRAGAPMTARLLSWPLASQETAAGYLAGMYDAEGHAEAVGSPRITQRLESEVLGRVVAAGALLGCDFRREAWIDNGKGGVRLYGEPMLPALLRFYGLTRPAITRKVTIWNRPIRNTWVRVLAVEVGPRERLITLSTTTKTFVADGYASHNCPFVAHCWPTAKLAIEDERPHFWITREDYLASGVSYRSPE